MTAQRNFDYTQCDLSAAATLVSMVSISSKKGRARQCQLQEREIASLSQSSQTGQNLSDQQLVARVQHGDKHAFDLLVIKYQSRILSVIGRYIQDTHEAMDVAQEAFIKAYRALANFRGESAFYTWLYRIAINTAKNHLVSKGRRPPATDVDAGDAEFHQGSQGLKNIDSPERKLLQQELESVIYQAIAELPEELKVALTLREFDGLSYEEIAEVMDCPVGTVRSRIFRARDAVDQKIKPLMSHHEAK